MWGGTELQVGRAQRHRKKDDRAEDVLKKITRGMKRREVQQENV